MPSIGDSASRTENAPGDAELAQRRDAALEVRVHERQGSVVRPRDVEQRHRGSEAPREPSARPDVGLAGLADRGADEDALDLARQTARQQQRSRHAPRELFAEGRPGLAAAARRLDLSGAGDHEVVGRLALLGGDLGRGIAPADADRDVVEARLGGPLGERVAERVLAARVGGDAEDRHDRVERVDERPRELERRTRCPRPSSQTSRRGVGCRRMCQASSTTQGRGGGGSAWAGTAASSTTPSSPKAGGGTTWRTPVSGGSRTRMRRWAPENVVSTISPRPSVDAGGRRLVGRERDLLGPDEDADAVALVVRHVGRNRERQRPELHAVAAAAADEHRAGAEEGRDVERARPLVEPLRRPDLEQPAAVERRRCACPSSNASSWSCVTRIVVMPSDRWISLRFWRSCARILTSSAPKGSSSSRTVGPVGERARERDALLLAARELALVAAAEAAEADEIEQLVAAVGRARTACTPRMRRPNSMFSATVMWRKIE